MNPQLIKKKHKNKLRISGGTIALLVILGGLVFVSSYMSYMALAVNDTGGAWFFGFFGMLFGLPFIAVVINTLSQQNNFFKSMDNLLSGKSKPGVNFVPHWYMKTTIIIAVISILAAIFLPIIF